MPVSRPLDRIIEARGPCQLQKRYGAELAKRCLFSQLRKNTIGTDDITLHRLIRSRYLSLSRLRHAAEGAWEVRQKVLERMGLRVPQEA